MYLGRKIISKIGGFYCLALFLSCIFTFLLTNQCTAQALPLKDTTSAVIVDSLLSKTDSIGSQAVDTLLRDSLTTKKIEDSLGIKISKDALPSVVNAEATDSAVLNMRQKIFYLYGDAKITYEDMTLHAGEVTYDQATNTVTAAPSIDSSSDEKKLPEFTQGQEKFTYDTLQYNFKSKRAIVRNARSQ